MNRLSQPQREIYDHQGYLRPLMASTASYMAAEFFLLLVFGLILFPGGPLLNKVLWTLVFCGIAMGQRWGRL
jgi:hypothetical protein